jgi:hypothetical protein
MPQATEVRERIVNATDEGVVDAVAFVRGARSLLDLCADYVRPHSGAAQREGTLRPDITVEGAVEFLFRIIPSMIVMPREDEPREFLRTYVVPALAEST